MRYLFIILFFLPLFLFGQSITSPPSRIYQFNTSNQDGSGFVLSGFNSSSVLLASIGFVNPPAGTTFSITTTSGLSFATGYNSWSNITRISFTGTMANINNALASLKVNTGSTLGNVQISVTATVNPVGYYYNPINGHFYRPISTTATYDNAKALSASQTFKGQTGYLVTITSANEEAFIISNVPQTNIWFALTDRVQEGYWRIDAGPENGTLIKTQNGQTAGNIAGQYNNWCVGEPNNSGDEDFAVTKWGGGSCWNDLPGSASWSNPYIVEFGTWANPEQQTFTDFYSANVTNQVSLGSISGTISVPSLSTYPTISLFRVVNGVDNLIETKTVTSSGFFTFSIPAQNTTYKLIPSFSVDGVTSQDFNLVFDETKNISTPTSTPSGLVLTGTKQWKASDVNRNGILDLGDAYLVAAHITGFRPITEVLWFSSSNYDLINKNNFGSINPVTSFTLNFTTNSLTQNIKYCVLGDVNLSHSSQ
jgi:hypothetical protein